MTEDELEELIGDCPTLYHMAEKGAWEGGIRERGLLSTTALLNLYKIPQPHRREIEERCRPESATIQGDGLPDAIIRDQKPMSDEGLERCLPNDMTPPDWYRLLNSKVFFWPTKKRLEKMMPAYQGKPHDVLEIDTRSLVEAHRCCIWLSHMNTGCTKPYPHPRGRDTFARIRDYRYDQRPPDNRVAELAVDYAVPDIRNHVKRVNRMIMKDGKITCHVIEEGIGAPDHKPLSTRFRILCSQLSCLWRRFRVWLHSWRFRLSHLWQRFRVWWAQLL